MNIALFAADTVGLEIARFFGENKEPLACLVLDSKDTNEINSQILERAGANFEQVFYSDSLYEEETLSALKALNLDIVILAWWPYIIKKNLIQIPSVGCLNFHPSYLPYNRGKNYNFWTIVEDVPFGVTLHWIDEGVDTGDIAYQNLIEKTWEDTGQTLYYKAQAAIVKLFEENFPEIKRGAIPRFPQKLDEGTFHRSSELEEASRIDLNKTYKARDLLNILRARTFPPYSGAWFIDNEERYEARIQIKRVDDERQTN